MPEQDQNIETEEALKAEEESLQSGSTFDRRYLIHSLLGKGGAGSVYKAEDQLLKRTVALKLMSKDLLDSDTKLDRFQREAQILSQLSHPNLVSIYAFGLTPEFQPYLSMPFLEGKTLQEIIDQEGKLDVFRAAVLFDMLCSGLRQIHESGLVHRDLKPGNIMVIKDDDGIETAKIVDFGIAKFTDNTSLDIQKLTSTGEVFGSPFYMSREQWQAKEVDHRSDIYSLGCIFYETLCGQTPWALEALLEVMLDNKDIPMKSLKSLKSVKSSKSLNASNSTHDEVVSDELEKLILKAMQLDPDMRYQNIGTLHQDLISCPEYKSAINNPTSTSRLQDFRKRKSAKHKISPLQLIAGLVLIAALVTVTLSGFANTPQGKIAGLLLQIKIDTGFSATENKASFKHKLELAEFLDSNNDKSEARAAYNELAKSKLFETTLTKKKQADILSKLAMLEHSAKEFTQASIHAHKSVSLLTDLAIAAELRKKELSLDYYHKAADQRELWSPRNYELESRTLLQLAQSEEQLAAEKPGKRYEQLAENDYKRALAALTAAASRDSNEIALLYCRLALIKQKQGRNEESFTDYKTALEALETSKLSQSAGLAIIASGLEQNGIAFMHSENYAKAAESFLLSLSAYESILGKSSEKLSGPLLYLARAEGFAGNKQESTANYKRALLLLTKNSDPAMLANILIGLADNQLASSDYKNAGRNYKEALNLIEKNTPALNSLLGAVKSGLETVKSHS